MDAPRDSCADQRILWIPRPYELSTGSLNCTLSISVQTPRAIYTWLNCLLSTIPYLASRANVLSLKIGELRMISSPCL